MALVGAIRCAVLVLREGFMSGGISAVRSAVVSNSVRAGTEAASLQRLAFSLRRCDAGGARRSAPRGNSPDVRRYFSPGPINHSHGTK